MSGNENKVVINLSSECLKKMANDPEFAKKVEFNLTGAVPGQNRMFAQAKADNAVIHGVTTVIDADGNASVTCGGMTRTSGSKQNSKPALNMPGKTYGSMDLSRGWLWHYGVS